jgi:hypothetical protein
VHVSHKEEEEEEDEEEEVSNNDSYNFPSTIIVFFTAYQQI